MNEQYFEGDSLTKLYGYAWKIAWNLKLPRTLSREDLVQEGINEVWLHRDRFELRPYKESNFFYWAYVVMRYGMRTAIGNEIGGVPSPNAAPYVPHKRLGYQNTTYLVESDDYIGSESADLEERLLLDDLLAPLTDIQRTVVLLKMSGYLHHEINQLTGRGHSSANTAIKEAKQKWVKLGLLNADQIPGKKDSSDRAYLNPKIKEPMTEKQRTDKAYREKYTTGPSYYAKRGSRQSDNENV